jgi:uncharacterized protein YndB with AHSA1/START domain
MRNMGTVEKSIEVDVPVTTAYNQWTQFEEFPRFMEGVREVRQMDDTRLYWKAEVGGREKEWYARIIDQEPDRRIAWQSEQGARNGGEVSFEPLDGSRTNISCACSTSRRLRRVTGTCLGSYPAASRATWSVSRSSLRLAARKPGPGAAAFGPISRSEEYVAGEERFARAYREGRQDGRAH